LSPDGTACASVWESRTSPGLITKQASEKSEAFLFYAFRLTASVCAYRLHLRLKRAPKMPEWNSDRQLLQLIRRELFTAVVGDVCDDLGLRDRFLPPLITPLGGRLPAVMAGRAMPVLEQDLDGEPANDSQFGLMFKALDSLQMDE